MDFASQRTKMVDNQIRTTDVTSRSILNAFLDVPREKFVPAAKSALAYIDTDIEVAPGRYIMEPSPLAKLVQLLAPTADDRVLVVGGEAGYAAAILAEIARKVVVLESDDALVETLRTNLSDLGNTSVVKGALNEGARSDAPYDAIFINGAVELIPEALFQQLSEGGRLVAVVGENLSSVARIYIRENGTQSERFAFNTSVKMLPGFQKIPEFVF